MVPGWLATIGNLAPFLLMISVGIVGFGIYRLKVFMAVRNFEREEEERKRREFIKRLDLKIARERVKD